MSLSLRQPLSAWLLCALLSATLVHGLCWLSVLTLLGYPSFTEVQRQIVLSLFWMGGALVLWHLSGAKSRLHALFTVLGCAAFVIVAGSIAAFAKLSFMDGIALDPAFFLLSSIMAIGHIFLSVPSSFALQQLALGRVKPESDQ